MKRSISIAVAGALLCVPVLAAEQATTVRPTEMKAKPFSDAATVASLAASAKVDVLERQASWMQVKANNAVGWVKMLSLRFDAGGGPTGKGGSAALLFNLAATGSSGSTATNAVKGINEEALKNPRPNPDALRVMTSLQLSQAEMDAFARAGKLDAKPMAYVPAPLASAASEGAKK